MSAGTLLSSAPSLRRTVESEGILRMLLLVAILAMPVGTMIFLKIQSTRLSYAMGDVKERIRKEEEFHRKLMLERSRYQRDEEVQVYAEKSGLEPRKQGHLVHRAFTPEDQKIARLRPVSSDGQ
ncbi:MAG: hypothetical protein WCO20_06600 [Holophagaceae bacterium]|nr:hypothetical protein [Acidobacteriota bacterium]